MVVADEDVDALWPAAPSFMWIYDITNERRRCRSAPSKSKAPTRTVRRSRR